jgi:hypothetical protein
MATAKTTRELALERATKYSGTAATDNGLKRLWRSMPEVGSCVQIWVEPREIASRPNGRRGFLLTCRLRTYQKGDDPAWLTWS